MLISDFTIMCDDCGRNYRISSDSLDADYACSERPMGTEVQHIFYGEMDCQCGDRLLCGVLSHQRKERDILWECLLTQTTLHSKLL